MWCLIVSIPDCPFSYFNQYLAMGIKCLAKGNNIAHCDQESDVGAIYGPNTVWESPCFMIALDNMPVGKVANSGR